MGELDARAFLQIAAPADAGDASVPSTCGDPVGAPERLLLTANGTNSEIAAFNIATKTVPAGSKIDLATNFSNKYAIQAYKDLGVTRLKGPQNGVAKLPTVQGKTSLESANAYAALTGQPVPANSGPDLLGKIAAGGSSSATTTTGG